MGNTANMILVSLAVSLCFSSSRSITFYCPPETCFLLCSVYWSVFYNSRRSAVRSGRISRRLLHVPCPRARLPRCLWSWGKTPDNTPEHVLQHIGQWHTSGWHLLILRTGKDENQETGLGPFLLRFQKSAARQMLRFLLSGKPGKTLLAHTSVCADTPLVCVQIKHTTQRCKEEKRRYEAGLKQKVLSGSTSNRIPFIFDTGGNVENPTGKS